MSTFNKYRLKGAFHYQWYETEDWYKYLVDRCVKFVEDSQTRDAIDIGCGDGLLLQKLKDAGFSAFGVDTDPYAVKLCTDRGLDARLIGADELTSYESMKNRGCLTCLNVIEHLDNPESIKEIIRENIEYGAIITTIDYQGGTLGEDHRFEWTYEQMMDFFKEFNPKGFRYKDTEWIGVEITK